MHLQVGVTGPGLDVVRMLNAGDRPVVIGRGTECDVSVPDPERTVSRRHLEVWLEDGELHFRVLSEVNGVDLPTGAVAPKSQGVLQAGTPMKIGDYELKFDVVEDDPWSVFDREPSGIAPADSTVTAAPMEADPFDWGFQSTFGPQGTQMNSDSLGTGDAAAFLRGLGLHSGAQAAMTVGELEAIGRMVRMLAEAVLDLHEDVAEVKQDLRSEDRTMLAPRRQLNPLRSDWKPEAKLQYLFGGMQAAAGFSSPERSLKEVLHELAAHNEASAVAARHALHATLKEFEPGALKARLLAGGSRLFESGKAWDAYVKHYEQQAADMAGWTQRQLDRHFTESYLREIQRLRRESGGGKG